MQAFCNTQSNFDMKKTVCHGQIYISIHFHSYLQRNTESQCIGNIEVTVNLLIKLEFKIYEQESLLKWTQEWEFLGFAINSKNMFISI